jgi:uncharacterized membrane protein YfcA
MCTGRANILRGFEGLPWGSWRRTVGAMVTVAAYLAIGLAVFFSAVFQAVTGFGFNLICTPILFLLVDPKWAVMVLVIPGWLACWTAAHPIRKSTPWRDVLIYSAWTPIGLFIGVYFLDVMPVTGLKILMAALLLHALVARWTPVFFRWLQWTPLSGVMAGIAGGALGTAGPPVVSWAHARDDWNLTVRRAATLYVFTILSGIRLPLYVAMGLFGEWKLVVIGLAAFPIVWLGSVVGGVIARKLSERVAHWIVRIAIISLIVTLVVGVIAGG